jgi:hypothetical protein
MNTRQVRFYSGKGQLARNFIFSWKARLKYLNQPAPLMNAAWEFARV